MKIPDGYIVVSIFNVDTDSAVWIGVLVAQQPTVETGSFVLLRDTMDARVYLGCVMDAGRRVLQWVEIWVQTVAGLKRSPATVSGALSNHVLDERWRRIAETLRTQEQCIWTGRETCHPLPLFIQMSSALPVFPRTAGGMPWSLCLDDALLERHGLPPYRVSLDRYLVADGGLDGVKFFPVTPEALTGTATVSLEEVIGSGEGLIPLNPEGGLMLIRPYHALGFAEYLDVLAGGACTGISCGRATLDPYQMNELIGHPAEPNRMFLETTATEERLIEIFYLKMGLIADAMKETEAFIRGVQRPLLDLDENAFRVHLSPQGSSIPILWTAQAVLVGSGDAVELPLEATETRYFVRGHGQDLSIYRPQPMGFASAGQCVVRIRQMLPETRKGLSVEGTFQTRDVLTVGSCDLVWLRLPLPTGVVDLYAHLEECGTATRGEWRFRTVEQRFDPMRAASLKALEGIPVQNIPYEVLPQQSTPCDLYALAVLAVRVLLVNEQNKLPVALDSVLSLAREAECAGASDETLSTVIAAAFESDPKWKLSIGPQFMVGAEMDSEQAFHCMPLSLWFDTLSMVIRMFPGQGDFRTCHHLGDAPEGALQNVLRRCREDILRLSDRVRCLVTGDLARNQELCTIVRTCRKKIG